MSNDEEIEFWITLNSSLNVHMKSSIGDVDLNIPAKKELPVIDKEVCVEISNVVNGYISNIPSGSVEIQLDKFIELITQ